MSISSNWTKGILKKKSKAMSIVWQQAKHIGRNQIKLLTTLPFWFLNFLWAQIQNLKGPIGEELIFTWIRMLIKTCKKLEFWEKFNWKYLLHCIFVFTPTNHKCFWNIFVEKLINVKSMSLPVCPVGFEILPQKTRNLRSKKCQWSQYIDLNPTFETLLGQDYLIFNLAHVAERFSVEMSPCFILCIPKSSDLYWVILNIFWSFSWQFLN